MKKNKYLLLGSSVGVLLLLLVAAVQENWLKSWRRIQKSGHGEEGRLSVQLRQIVNPALGISDRCVSCHVSMGPGEQSVRGNKLLVPHPPVVHDPAEFGCTVCHGGQGQATDEADAHGTVPFWPEPMLERKFFFAGCGRCHVALGIPEGGEMAKAQALFERSDCLSCHRLENRGGTLRPGGGGMEGPDLSRIGLTGYDSAWYDKHLQKSNLAAAGPWKSNFAPLSSEDQRELALFLKSRVAASRLVSAKSTFFSSGCLGCHKVSGVGGDEGPELTRVGEKDPGQLSFRHVPGEATLSNWMVEHFRAPSSVVAGSQMPPVNLSTEEIDRLTLFTLSLRRKELKDAYLPRDRIRAVKFMDREFDSNGTTIFGAFCSGCHGRDGLGRRVLGVTSFPSIANPDFLALATDDFLARTIKTGRPGRKMPAWLKEGGLRPTEIEAVVAFIRKSGAVVPEPDSKPARWVQGDVREGRHLFESVCDGCHGAQGRGGEGPALNNKGLMIAATDTFLVETVSRGRRGTAMTGFLAASTVRPALTRQEIESIVTYLRTLEGNKP
jgi:mono/diheme cytochrome c family protein